MLYLIGGAARADKTLLARRLLNEHTIPCFSVDYFVTALGAGAPELGIHGDLPNQERAERLWARLAPLLHNIVEEEPAYTVDGDALLPAGVAALAVEYPEQVRACFLGYTRATAEQKLQDIHRFGGGVNDWTQDCSDEYILALCQEMIEFSAYVQAECQRHELAYFDVSTNFTSTLEAAYRYLLV